MNKPAENASLHSNDVLARNTVINFLGHAIPLAVAVVAIPFVIDGLGTERFGILTIVWIIIGYFGLFDMGIGRATTKFVADFQAEGRGYLQPFVVTSIFLLILFGLLASLLIVLLTPFIVNDILNIPNELKGETISAFYILSSSIPFVLGSIGARGALEARQKFKIVNIIKIPASIINYLAPIMVLPFSNSLKYVVIILVAGRVTTFLVYTYFSLKDGTSFSFSRYPVFKWVKDLLGFGAWITVSNFISPIMVYMDRFILGAILTMSAVAYYTTPYEVVTRLLIISGSFMGVMFPAFSAFSIQNRDKLAEAHRRSVRYTIFAIVPLVLFIAISAHPLLLFWLGEEFATNSTTVMQLLAVGVLFNAIAMVPYTALQAVGRPDITAKLHMAELPVYLLMIWFFTIKMGIEGVALAWVIRVLIDGLLLSYFFNDLVPVFSFNWNRIGRWTFIGIVGIAALFFLYSALENPYLILLLAAFCALSGYLLLWKWMMHESEKSKIVQLIRNYKTLLR